METSVWMPSDTNRVRPDFLRRPMRPSWLDLVWPLALHVAATAKSAEIAGLAGEAVLTGHAVRAARPTKSPPSRKQSGKTVRVCEPSQSRTGMSCRPPSRPQRHAATTSLQRRQPGEIKSKYRIDSLWTWLQIGVTRPFVFQKLFVVVFVLGGHRTIL